MGALSVGMVLFGPNDEGRCERAVRAFALAVQRERGGVESPLDLNVVFHVEGSNGTPEFTEVRTGRYRRPTLMVQAALYPEQTADADSEVARLALAAVDQAERWSARRGEPLSLDAVRDIVRRAAASTY